MALFRRRLVTAGRYLHYTLNERAVSVHETARNPMTTKKKAPTFRLERLVEISGIEPLTS